MRGRDFSLRREKRNSSATCMLFAGCIDTPDIESLGPNQFKARSYRTVIAFPEF